MKKTTQKKVGNKWETTAESTDEAFVGNQLTADLIYRYIRKSSSYRITSSYRYEDGATVLTVYYGNGYRSIYEVVV